MQAASALARSGRLAIPRVQSVDLLRGAVMMVMAIDHVRDFFSYAAYHFSPEDLSRTTPELFFTRWITHFCAPVFIFLAGVSTELSSHGRRTTAETSRHLAARGLWLIVVELTVMELIWTFNLRYELVILQVIWAIGWSMLALAAFVWLPRRVLAGLCIATIALHNCLDRVAPASLGQWSWLWRVLHGTGLFTSGHTNVFLLYPLVPWVTVMAAGYCFGPVFRLDPARRRRTLLVLGATLTAAFAVLRFVNIYGDPQPWSPQSSAMFTVLSFLRTAKYPPSLEYLLMTLGPAILVLGLLDRFSVGERNPFRVFGRVPMFYYICHFALIHAVALLVSRLRYGRWDYFLHLPGALVGLPDPTFPADWGFGLAGVYLIWFGVVAVLYLPCLWYMRVKAASRSRALSYL